MLLLTPLKNGLRPGAPSCRYRCLSVDNGQLFGYVLNVRVAQGTRACSWGERKLRVRMRSQKNGRPNPKRGGDSMKKSWIGVLAIGWALVLSLPASAADAQPKTVSIGTHPMGSMFNIIGTDAATVVATNPTI